MPAETNSVEIGFLGGGRMASAICDGLGGQFAEEQIGVFDPALSEKGTWGERKSCVFKSAEELFVSAKWLVWAIKPQVFNDQLPNLSQFQFKGEGMLSVMAGIGSDKIEAAFPNVPLIRTMPNTPMMYGEGMVALSLGTHANEDHMCLVESWFDKLGKTLRVEESQMDGVTAVSGSGPAYVFYLSEAVQSIAAELGLEPKKALDLWIQTLKGAATMMEKGTAPSDLRVQVTSPGGTTQAALESFAENNLDQIFAKSLMAAKRRSVELSG